MCTGDSAHVWGPSTTAALLAAPGKGLACPASSASRKTSVLCLLHDNCEQDKAYDLDELEAKLDELEAEMLEVNGNSERLARSYSELVELQLVRGAGRSGAGGGGCACLGLRDLVGCQPGGSETHTLRAGRHLQGQGGRALGSSGQ